MKASRANLIIVSLACLTVVSLAGSSLGTLAWYAYSTRATAAYSGTAVSKTEQLQIGLLWGDKDKASDATLEDTYLATKEVVGDYSYYFMPAGKGFSSTAINYYLSKFGHATNVLPPVTSRAYAGGALGSLYESPVYYHNTEFAVADPSHYVELPFVFRVLSTSGIGIEDTDDKSVSSANIWLTDAVAQTEGVKDVSNALRIHVRNHAQAASEAFILNPSAEHQGSTNVSGLLDLNKDGFYDFKRIDGVDKELIYGDHATDETELVTFDQEQEANFSDINQTGKGNVAYDEEERNTFYARHRHGVDGYPSYAAAAPKTASYLSFEDIRPTEVEGVFSGDYPLATTSVQLTDTGERTAIGRVDLTIWLEGWDHAIIDANIGARYNLGLQFEIDRV